MEWVMSHGNGFETSPDGIYTVEGLVLTRDLHEIILCCLITSLVWGATNPLIKKATKDIKSVESNSAIKRFYYELKYLVFNWRYVVLFLINQSGSLLYFLLLQNADLSLIVPLTNALTLIVTGIFGIVLGEEKPSLGLFFGTCVVLAGIALCVLDKIQEITEVPV